MKIATCDVKLPVNNATAYMGFDDVTPASPFLHVHVHVLRVAKPLWYLKVAFRVEVTLNDAYVFLFTTLSVTQICCPYFYEIMFNHLGTVSFECFG